MQGTVKFFNETKGFGFIRSDNSPEDVFVTTSGLIDKIRQNDKVEFEQQHGTKGPIAVNVRALRSPKFDL